MGNIQKIRKIFHAAIYVRLSKEDGDVADAGKKESNSISNQKSLIRDFLRDKEDIEIVSERVDDGYSGSNFERPQNYKNGQQAILPDMNRLMEGIAKLPEQMFASQGSGTMSQTPGSILGFQQQILKQKEKPLK